MAIIISIHEREEGEAKQEIRERVKKKLERVFENYKRNLKNEIKKDIKQKIRCEKCEEILTDSKNIKWLELSNTDGNYYSMLPKDHVSQGAFPFGTACATTVLNEQEKR